jgi:hypothetical protein
MRFPRGTSRPRDALREEEEVVKRSRAAEMKKARRSEPFDAILEGEQSPRHRVGYTISMKVQEGKH